MTASSDNASRFWQHVAKTDSCWHWTAAKTGTGYGNFVLVSRRPYRYVGAHRFAYELLVGPIPDGMQLDHLCRNPGCVNPEHLEPVTNQENTRRGLVGALKTQCKRGHPWVPENVGIRRKWGRTSRHCLVCTREHNARTTERRRRERQQARVA